MKRDDANRFRLTGRTLSRQTRSLAVHHHHYHGLFFFFELNKLDDVSRNSERTFNDVSPNGVSFEIGTAQLKDVPQRKVKETSRGYRPSKFNPRYYLTSVVGRRNVE